MPRDVLDWIDQVRPYAEGKPRMILPIWRDIYNDSSNNKMIVGGRQIFKSTYTTDILAFEGTSKRDSQLVYVTYDDNNRTGFSRQKLQIGTFESNPILRQFPRNKLGNVGEISLKNGSTIYVTTDHGQYHHVEGKSAEHVMLDEAQYQEMENFERVRLTMTMTQGKLSVLGIGAEQGGAYHNLWLETDQREWVHDDPFWREKLKFGWNVDPVSKARKWGLIQDDYLLDVCKGRWKGNPDAGDVSWHGYHVPQEHFPQIPLTIEEAKTKYRTDPTYSLEWKEKYLPYSLYITHVKGEFYQGLRHPITRAMLEQCMVNHKELNYLEPEEIAEIKAEYGDRVKIVMGVDFGSGKTSQTVIMILIKYYEDEGSEIKAPVDKVRLAFYDVRPPETQIEQAQYINKVFKDANCDVGIGDWGYGQNQILLIQEGGADRFTGEIYSGVGTNKFFGLRAHGDETRPMAEWVEDIDEHGRKVPHLKADKTTMIQQFVDFLHEIVVDPEHPFDKEKQMPKLMLPSNEEADRKNAWLVKDWTSLVRIDLPEDLEGDEVDKRQTAKKQYNHPPDSLAAVVLAFQAFSIGDRWNVVSTG